MYNNNIVYHYTPQEIRRPHPPGSRCIYIIIIYVYNIVYYYLYNIIYYYNNCIIIIIILYIFIRLTRPDALTLQAAAICICSRYDI